MAPKMAPTAEPAFDPVLSPEEVCTACMAVDAFAEEALVGVVGSEALVDVVPTEAAVEVIAGETLVVFGPELAAVEGDGVPRPVCDALGVLVGVVNPATVTRNSAAVPVVIPLMVPQPQFSVASLSHSNL